MRTRPARPALRLRLILATLGSIAYSAIPAGAALERDGAKIARGDDGLLLPGSPAPDFTLSDQRGSAVRLADLRGAPIVLYFYPMDDTPGCIKEACSFRDEMGSYDSLGVRVLGVSTDDRRSHQAFAAKYGLNFPLLADTTGGVSRLFGCGVEIEQQGRKRWIAGRVTYLIDAEGMIRRVWPKVNPVGHAAEILEAMENLEADPLK